MSRWRPGLPLVHHLPEEILEEIFLLLSEEARVIISQPEGVPWNLTQVCARWRRIVMSLPVLWSTINFDHRRTINGHTIYYRAQLCMARSQSHLLKVSYETQCYYNRDILDLLVGSSARWLSASFDLTNREHIWFLKPICGRLPELRYLQVKTHKSSPSPYMNMFSIAPKLAYLSLSSGNPNGKILRPLLFPWSQLQHLKFSTPTPSLILGAIAKQAKQLTTLEIGDSLPFLQPEEATVAFPSVKTLLISCTTVPSVFYTLSLPNLKNITFNPLVGTSLHATLSMISRSQCSPKQVTLCDHLSQANPISFLTATDINDFEPTINLLNAIPSVTTLEIAMANASSKKLLSCMTSVSGLLPNLETIRLYRCGPDNICALVDLVLHRLGNLHGVSHGHSCDSLSGLLKALKKGPSTLRVVKFLYRGDCDGCGCLAQLGTLSQKGFIGLNTSWSPRSNHDMCFEAFGRFERLN